MDDVGQAFEAASGESPAATLKKTSLALSSEMGEISIAHVSPLVTAPAAIPASILVSPELEYPVNAIASSISTIPGLTGEIPSKPAHKPVPSYHGRSRNPVEAYFAAGIASPASFRTLHPNDVHEVEDGKWLSRIPRFSVSVPSFTQRHELEGKGEHTVFDVVSHLPVQALQSEASELLIQQSKGSASPLCQPFTVQRRYNHFHYLHTVLTASFPLQSIPDLPEKRLTRRFSRDFLLQRRRDLGRYLRRLARHDLLRCHKVFLDFLTLEDVAVGLSSRQVLSPI